MTGRDPSPAASFNEPPTFLSGAFWAMRAGAAPARRGPSPDLFARLRARRRVEARLVVGATVAVGGLALLIAVPALGLAVVVVATWLIAIDLLLHARLRHSIAAAWVDLVRPED